MTGTGSAPANTTSMASMTRESSPPEAPLCTGRGGAPGWGASSSATSSMPSAPGSLGVAVDREGRPCALFMASPASSAPTSAANPSAAARRPADTWAARSSTSARAVSRAAASASSASSETSSADSFGGGVLGPGQHARQALARAGVLADQRGDHGAPVEHLGEAAGVGVEVGDVAGQLRRRRRTTTATASATSCASRTSVGVVGGGQRPLRDGQRRRRVLRQVVAAEVAGHVADQRDPRLVGRGAQRVGVAEPLGLGVEVVVLARLGRDGLDLLESVPEDVGGLGELARLAAPAVEVGGELAPALVGRAVAVEQRQVRRRRRSGRGHAAARPVGTAAAGRTGRARRAAPRRARLTTPTGTLRPPRNARDRPSALTVRARIRLPSSSGSAPASAARSHAGDSGGQHEPALHARPAGGADPAGVGPATEEQGQAGHDHRLAGAGLARDDGEPAAQLEGDVVDRAQPADAQLGQSPEASRGSSAVRGRRRRSARRRSA